MKSKTVGLKFPKEKAKKKRKSHPKSILATQKGRCYLCGRYTNTEVHHVFEGTANKKISEEYGIKVDLCPDCHRDGPHAVHRDQEVMEKLHKLGQEAFEEKGGSREEFMEIFGRNWL